MSVEEDIEAVFPINFDDLNIEAQRRLLEFMEVDSPAALNWDVFPLFSISRGMENEEV